MINRNYESTLKVTVKINIEILNPNLAEADLEEIENAVVSNLYMMGLAQDEDENYIICMSENEVIQAIPEQYVMASDTVLAIAKVSASTPEFM